MPISGEEFMRMSLEEVVHMLSTPCTECGCDIEEHSDEQYLLSHKPVCGDCYFSTLGEFLEERPYLVR